MAKNITPFEGLYCRIISWLGLVDMFQTFEEEENDNIAQEIREIRKLLNEEDSNGREP
jgi:hypothetical protein